MIALFSLRSCDIEQGKPDYKMNDIFQDCARWVFGDICMLTHEIVAQEKGTSGPTKNGFREYLSIPGICK